MFSKISISRICSVLVITILMLGQVSFAQAAAPLASIHTSDNSVKPLQITSSGTMTDLPGTMMTNSVLSWNTFLGSPNWDETTDIVMDGSGNMYVLGGSSTSWGTPINPFLGGMVVTFLLPN
jgi:hypothetical protein